MGAHGLTVSGSRLNPNNQDTVLWEKPTLGRYKCNIDASFSSHIGMCIHDDAG